MSFLLPSLHDYWFANTFATRHVKTLVGEIDFSFHALNPSGTNPGGLSMKANDKTE